MRGLIRKPKDLISGLFFVAVGAFAFVYSYNYSFGVARRMGPAYFPWLLGGLLTILGAILVVRSLRGPQDLIGRVPIKPAALVLGAAVLFGFLLPRAGLVIAIIVTVLVGSMADSEITPLQSATLAAGLAAASAVVFVYLLGQPLPILGSWFG